MTGVRPKEFVNPGFNFDAVKDLLRCPQSKSPLVLDGDSLVSVDPECRLRYEIRDGIPSMVPDDAVVLSREQWSGVMVRNGRDPQTGRLVDVPGAGAGCS